jgi:hypothetical protein
MPEIGDEEIHEIFFEENTRKSDSVLFRPPTPAHLSYRVRYLLAILTGRFLSFSILISYIFVRLTLLNSKGADVKK